MDAFIHDLRWQHDPHEWRARARRELVSTMWLRYRRPDGDGRARILDIGCGTGAALEDLRRFGDVVGVDVSAAAVTYCRRRRLDQTAVADGAGLPFRPSLFDLVVMVEVLEHVEDDAAALRDVARVLTPEGLLVMTVPAFRWLWSIRDVRLQHRRRYTRAALTARLRAVGFEPIWSSYVDLFLLPALAAMVGVARGAHFDGHLEHYALTAPGPLNGLLLGISRAERAVYSRVPLPCGVSVACVARKRE